MPGGGHLQFGILQNTLIIETWTIRYKLSGTNGMPDFIQLSKECTKKRRKELPTQIRNRANDPQGMEKLWIELWVCPLTWLNC